MSRIDPLPQLLQFSRGPGGNSLAQEGLDAALALGAFDVSCEVLFQGDALLNLLKTVGTPTELQKRFSALPMFGIEKLFVIREDLEKLGLRVEDLSLPVAVLPLSEVGDFLSKHDQILSF